MKYLSKYSMLGILLLTNLLYGPSTLANECRRVLSGELLDSDGLDNLRGDHEGWNIENSPEDSRFSTGTHESVTGNNVIDGESSDLNPWASLFKPPNSPGSLIPRSSADPAELRTNGNALARIDNDEAYNKGSKSLLSRFTRPMKAWLGGNSYEKRELSHRTKIDLENFFRIHKISSFLEQNSKPGKDTFYLGGSLVINLTAIREKIKAIGLDPFTTMAVIQSIENDRPFNWAAMEILEKNVNLGALDRALVANGEVAHLLNLDPVLLGGNYDELLQSRASRISDFFTEHQIMARIHDELARQGYRRQTREPHFYIVPEWVEYARGWTDISVKVLSQNQQLKDIKININRSQGEDPAELLVREIAGHILNINRARSALPLLPE